MVQAESDRRRQPDLHLPLVSCASSITRGRLVWLSADMIQTCLAKRPVEDQEVQLRHHVTQFSTTSPAPA
jgi:hypothetical protein